MKIRILHEITTDVIESVNEANEVIDSVPETFLAGEVIEADVFEFDDTQSGLQFGDGSVMYLPNNTFEKLVD
jgi:hypothetical protein